MTVLIHQTAAAVPPAAVMRVLAQFDRTELEGFISIAIGLLDVADGDPDLEDASDLEDDFSLSDNASLLDGSEGPGCSISDAGGQHDEDDFNTVLKWRYADQGPGCTISDNDIEYDGREEIECHD